MINAGELRRKNETLHKYMLGFGLVSCVVKVFMVSYLFLARKSTRNDVPWWRNGIVVHVQVHVLTATSHDQFEIPFRHQGASFVVDSLAKKRELTKQTFISRKPDIHVKFISRGPWTSDHVPFLSVWDLDCMCGASGSLGVCGRRPEFPGWNVVYNKIC